MASLASSMVSLASDCAMAPTWLLFQGPGSGASGTAVAPPLLPPALARVTSDYLRSSGGVASQRRVRFGPAACEFGPGTCGLTVCSMPCCWSCEKGTRSPTNRDDMVVAPKQDEGISVGRYLRGRACSRQAPLCCRMSSDGSALSVTFRLSDRYGLISRLPRSCLDGMTCSRYFFGIHIQEIFGVGERQEPPGRRSALWDRR